MTHASSKSIDSFAFTHASQRNVSRTTPNHSRFHSLSTQRETPSDHHSSTTLTPSHLHRNVSERARTGTLAQITKARLAGSKGANGQFVRLEEEDSATIVKRSRTSWKAWAVNEGQRAPADVSRQHKPRWSRCTSCSSSSLFFLHSLHVLILPPPGRLQTIDHAHMANHSCDSPCLCCTSLCAEQQLDSGQSPLWQGLYRLSVGRLDPAT